MAAINLKPIHPGEVLQEEFIKPFGLTTETLAAGTNISVALIKKITSKQIALTADIALRFARFFGTSAQFWLGLQTDYDLDVAKSKIGNKLEKEIVPLAA